MNKRPSYRTIATFLSAIFIPAGIAIGTITGGIAKLINPDNIDVWQPLAYLGHAIVPGMIVSVLLLLGAIVYTILALKSGSGKLPLTILLVNLVLLLGVLIGQGAVKTAEDNWARDNGGMTHEQRDAKLREFFNKIEEQKAN